MPRMVQFGCSTGPNSRITIYSTSSWVIFCIIALAMIVNTSADWYVSPAGSDNNAGDAPESAWMTMSKACTTLAAMSDEAPLHLAGGDYALNVSCTMKRDLIGVNTEMERSAINMTGSGRLYYLNQSSRRTVRSVVLSGENTSGRIVWISSSLVTLDEVDIYIGSSSMAIQASNSLLEISHSTLTGSFGDESRIFTTLMSSNTTISDSLFVNVLGFTNAAVYGERGNLTVKRSTFSHLSNEFGGAIRFKLGDVYVEDSLFEYCRTMDPYGTTNGASVNVLTGGDVTLIRSQFYYNLGSHGTAAFISDSGDIYMEDCDFVNNTATYYGCLMIQRSSSITLVNNRIRGNIGGVGPAGVILSTAANVTRNHITGNEGSEGYGLYIGTLDSTNPRLPLDLVDNVFHHNVFSNNYSQYQVATSLYIIGALDVNFAGNWFDADHTEIAIRPLAISFASVTVVGSHINNSMPHMQGGFLLAGGNMSITQDWTIIGSFGFAHFDSAYDRRSNFWMNGHTITVPGDSWTYSLIMSANLYNGILAMNGGNAYFCCSKPDLYHRDIELHDVTMIGSDIEFIFATSTPVWGDANSRIIAQQNAVFSALNYNPTELHIPEFTFQNATLDVLDFTLFGNLTADSDSLFYGYPSLWNGTSHPMVIHGHIDAPNTPIALYDLFAIAPFSPTISLQDGYIDIIRLYDSSSSPNPAAGLPYPRNGTYTTTHYVTQVSGTTLTSAPVRIRPLPFIQTDLGSIALIFRTDIPFTTPSDCSGFLAPSAKLDAATLKCVQKDLRRIIVSSAKLPGPGDIIEINPTHPFAETFFVPMNPAVNPIVPVPVLRQVATQFSCGLIPLDGSLSTGFGSYEKTFIWALGASSASVADILPIAYYLNGLPDDTPIVNLPVSLLVPGAYYEFTLRVANIAHSSIATARVSFTAVSAFFMPPLILTGPAERKVYLGSDVTINAQIDAANCAWDSSKIRFVWSFKIGTGVIAPLGPELTNGRPSLFVPSSFLESYGETNITFHLHAYPDASLGYDETTNTSVSALVQSVYRPLAIKSGLTRNHFYDEDVVLSVEVSSLGGSASYDVQWSLVSCPVKSNYDYFRSLNPNQPDVAGDVRDGFDCINSAGVGFVFPFESRTSATTIVPRGSIESGSYVVQATVTTILGESETVTVAFKYNEQSGATLPVSVVIDSPPPNSIVATHKVSLSAKVDDLYEGLEADALYNFHWKTTFGDWVIPAERNGHSVLVIPPSALTPLQRMSISVEVTSKSEERPSGTNEVSIAVSEAPTGGRLVISPSAGDMALTYFTISAMDWTTKFWPLRYQYFIIDPNTQDLNLIESPLPQVSLSSSNSRSSKRFTSNTLLNANWKEIALTELTDLAVVTNLTLSVPPPPMTYSGPVTLKVRVIDALGGEAEAYTQITLYYPSNEVSKRNSYAAASESFLHNLEVAVNASNWQYASTLIGDFIGLAEAGIVEVDAETADQLVDIFTSLPGTVPLTEFNVVSILTQFSHYMEVIAPNTEVQAQKVQALLASIVNAPMSRFGSYSGYSAQSSEYFARTISSILKSPATRPLLASGDIDFNTLILAHGVQHLDSLVPGEPRVETNTHGFNLASGLVPTQSGEVQATTTESDVSAVFSPGGFSESATDGYVGYHFLYYRGSFPHMIDNFGFDTVAELQILKPQQFSSRRAVSTAQFGSTSALRSAETIPGARGASRSAKRDYLEARASLAGSTKMIFNVSTTLLQETKSDCAVWDEATRTWKRVCTTSTSSSGTVTCECGADVQGPLTVLFSNADPALPGNAKKGMSGSAIAAAVIVPLVVIAVGVIAFHFYKNHFSNRSSAELHDSHTSKANKNQVELETVISAPPATGPTSPAAVAATATAAAATGTATAPAANGGGGWTKSVKPPI